MKIWIWMMGIAFASFGIGGAAAGFPEPSPCSISVGVTTLFGTFRTWTNALETGILEEKGLGICQDDAILRLSDRQLAALDEAAWAKLLTCKTEFKLELLFR
jgi:hypothetical protein